MIENIKVFIKRRKLIPVAIWFVVYMALFVFLEVRPHKKVHLVHSKLDDKIPHVPQFIYPYLSWFPYIIVCVFLALKNLSDEDYKKALTVLSTGMNLFILIAYIWPTGLDFRDSITYNSEKLSGRLMKFVQTVDTPQSVFPSMHAYVTMVFQGTLEMQAGQLPRAGILFGRVLSVSIIASTVFTKQHSILDVIASVALYGTLETAYSFSQKKEN